MRCTSGEASGEGSLALWRFLGSRRSGLDELLVSPSVFGPGLQDFRDFSNLREVESCGNTQAYPLPQVSSNLALSTLL